MVQDVAPEDLAPDVDSEDRAPSGVFDVDTADVLTALRRDRGQRSQGGKQERHDADRTGDSPECGVGIPQQPCDRCEQRCGQVHGGRRSDRGVEWHGNGAGLAGAEQVGCVEAPDPLPATAQQRRDEHPDRHERQEEGEAHQTEPSGVEHRRTRRVLPEGHRVERHPGHDDVPQSGGDRTDQGRPGQHTFEGRLPQPS